MSSQADTYLHAITGKVVASYRREKGLAKIDETNQINAAVIVDIIARLRCLIFPGFFDHAPLDADTFETYAGTILAYLKRHLKEQVARALGYQPSDGRDSIDDAEKIVLAFLDRIPDIRRVLATDVLAAFQGDPSATSQDEIILSYPGLYAIMVNRLAHELYRLNVPLIPRMMTEHAHSLTGIDIHPGAAIGNHFFIDHGT
ncbi:MAG: hypothetical protein LBK01_06070, partial [Burkholderiaceae bacterium]|nr:hypothetical protein [Burkholderiaceae bacterium]